MSIRGRCPKCDALLTEEELRVDLALCPHCKTELHVFLKAGWLYAAASYTIGVVIAYLQGHESIILGVWGLVYGTVILALITFNRWELHLPIKVVEKPDYLTTLNLAAGPRNESRPALPECPRELGEYELHGNRRK